MKNTVKSYYQLTKPGIIYGNLLTTIGGFLYGAILRVSWPTLVWMAIGTALIIACGCVINNVLDRNIDKHMKRTKKRALVTGDISIKNALVFAATCGVLGIAVLAVFTNSLTLLLGIVGLVSYAGVYTYAKPRTVHGTLIGTIPGAIPPLAGYTAATNRIDVSFWIILAIMVCWQMVHFYAIATYRSKEYKAANIPVMPVVKGVLTAKVLMIIFAGGYILSILSLAHYGYAGLFYLAIMGPLALWWLLIVAGGLWTDDNDAWARKVFFISLLLVTAWSGCLAINAWTP